jgi:hypothetical protein
MFFKVSEKKLLKNEWGNLNNSLRSKEDDYNYRIRNMPGKYTDAKFAETTVHSHSALEQVALKL